MTDIILPSVQVQGAAVEAIVREVIEEWKRVRPREYKIWPKVCEERRKSLLDNGWSREREMFIPVVYPGYVLLMLQRKLGKNDLDEAEHQALLRVLPCCRMNTRAGTMSSVLCDGDKNK